MIACELCFFVEQQRHRPSLLPIDFTKSSREASRQLEHSGVLVLVHVPQLVSGEDDTGNDGSLNEGNDDGIFIASHSSALQSLDDSADAGVWTSGGGSCEATSASRSRENVMS